MELKTSYTQQETPEIATQGTDATSSNTTLTSEQSAKRTQFIIIAAVVVFIVVLVGVIALLYTNPPITEVIRDIAIVFVAVETLLIGLAMLLLIFQIQVLIRVLRDEIGPLLNSVNDTAATVRGTTEFVSQNVVNPFIKWAGFTAAVQRVTDDLINVVRSARPRSQSTQNPKGGNKDEQ